MYTLYIAYTWRGNKAVYNDFLIDIPDDEGVHVKSAGVKGEKYINTSSISAMLRASLATKPSR